MKPRPNRFDGPPCPEAIAAGVDHGPLLGDRATQGDGKGWYCPAQAHDGRLRSDPAGPSPATRARFSTAEVGR